MTRPDMAPPGSEAQTSGTLGRIVAERGEIVESVHRVHAVVADGGASHAVLGDPGIETTLRSSAKLFQALPLVEDGVADALDLFPAHLALCCASHNGELRHVRGAREILTRIGLDEGSLACGPHRPLGDAAARRLDEEGLRPGRIHNNCSGKHAGMLALAVHHGWPPVGYHEADHPVQRRMAEEISRWSGLEASAIPRGVDGCGIPCYSLPLRRLAEAFRDFGLAARARWDEGRGPARLLRAIGEAPGMIAGEERLCTVLAEVTAGRIVAKVGAEGVYGAVIPSEGIGIAVKVEDGSRRAVEPALVGVLADRELLSADELRRLARFRTPAVTNTRGETVGRLRFEAA